MKVSILILLFPVAMLCALATAASGTDCFCDFCNKAEMARHEATWPFGQVQCIASKAKKITKTAGAQQKLIECALHQFRCRDGALGFQDSDLLLFLMRQYPQAFFEVMQKHDEDFTDWLNNLGELSFRWFGDPPSPLEKQREDLIAFLTGLSVEGQKADRLRRRVLSTLKGITPTQVE